MKLRINWRSLSYQISKYAIVVIKRNTKGKIIYNSGLNYFYHYSAVREFMKVITSQPGLEIHKVNILSATEPKLDSASKGYWCPYCCKWEYWKTDPKGYKRCPICGISDGDYYVKAYNKLWHSGMKSKSSKKKEEKFKPKRRVKDDDNSSGNG